MHYRVGSAFAVICTLLTPFPASAQVAQSTVRGGPARPQTAPSYAQHAYPQTYGQPSILKLRSARLSAELRAARLSAELRSAHLSAELRAARLSQNYAPPPPHPQAYAQRPYSQAYYRPGYVAPAYSAAPVPTPAAYGQTPHSAHGSLYAAPYYGPAYIQGNRFRGVVGSAAGRGGRAARQNDGQPALRRDGCGRIRADRWRQSREGRLEASFWAVHGGSVPNSGLYLALDASTGFDIGCVGARATDGCKGHLRIHWIGIGPFFNTGTPMIAPERAAISGTSLALAGAEVRLWKGMTAKTTINWFVPNPWGVLTTRKA